MPGGRPKLSEEEKAKRAAAKEEATLAKAKAREDAKAAKAAKPKPTRQVGRPAKSLADRVADIRSGKVQVKNLYKEPEILFRAVQFPKSLTHALPTHIVKVLSERSPTRQAVAADPYFTDEAREQRALETFLEARGGLSAAWDWVQARGYANPWYFTVKKLYDTMDDERRKVSTKK